MCMQVDCVEQWLKAGVASIGVVYSLTVFVVSLQCVSDEPGERLAAYSGRCGPRCAQLA